MRLASFPWRGSLLTIGISFLCASVLSTLLARILFDDKVSVASQRSPKLKISSGRASLDPAGVKAIIDRNIFNSEGTTDQEAPERSQTLSPTTDVAKSDLPLKLVGTIFSGDPNSGIAIAENTAKRTINSFMVGDSLASDAKLFAIYQERIIIDRGAGRKEYIEIEKEELKQGRRRKKKASGPAKSQGLAPIATEPPPSHFKEDGFERSNQEILMTNTYRQKLLTTDFTKVLQDAKASPNIGAGGELKGFKLTRIRKDSIYEKSGLQNDDIVEEVNGVHLTDTAQAIRLLQSLRSESEIEVRVNRGGSNLTLNLKVR